MLITLRVESSSRLEVADEHQSIPLASIQSMYPGAVGLYQQTSDNNKCFVQFDGKSFVAPKDGWSPTESYCINVNLGRCFQKNMWMFLQHFEQRQNN
jgi:hypothetical protein